MIKHIVTLKNASPPEAPVDWSDVDRYGAKVLVFEF